MHVLVPCTEQEKNVIAGSLNVTYGRFSAGNIRQKLSRAGGPRMHGDEVRVHGGGVGHRMEHNIAI